MSSHCALQARRILQISGEQTTACSVDLGLMAFGSAAAKPAQPRGSGALEHLRAATPAAPAFGGAPRAHICQRLARPRLAPALRQLFSFGAATPDAPGIRSSRQLRGDTSSTGFWRSGHTGSASVRRGAATPASTDARGSRLLVWRRRGTDASVRGASGDARPRRGWLLLRRAGREHHARDTGTGSTAAAPDAGVRSEPAGGPAAPAFGTTIRPRPHRRLLREALSFGGAYEKGARGDARADARRLARQRRRRRRRCSAVRPPRRPRPRPPRQASASAGAPAATPAPTCRRSLSRGAPRRRDSAPHPGRRRPCGETGSTPVAFVSEPPPSGGSRARHGGACWWLQPASARPRRRPRRPPRGGDGRPPDLASAARHPHRRPQPRRPRRLQFYPTWRRRGRFGATPAAAPAPAAAAPAPAARLQLRRPGGRCAASGRRCDAGPAAAAGFSFGNRCRAGARRDDDRSEP